MNSYFKSKRGVYDDALPVLSKYFSNHINVLDADAKAHILYVNIGNKEGKLNLALAWPREIFVNNVLPVYGISMTPMLEKLLSDMGKITAVDCDSLRTGQLKFYCRISEKIKKMYTIKLEEGQNRDLLRMTYDIASGDITNHKHYINTHDNEYVNKIYEVKNGKPSLVYNQPCQCENGEEILFEDLWKLYDQLDRTKYRLVGSKRHDTGNSYISIRAMGRHEATIAEQNIPVQEGSSDYDQPS